MSKIFASHEDRRRFMRHFAEMCGAMVVGMIVLGAAVRLYCAMSGHPDLLDHPGASAPIMTANMAIGMAVWMRYRGHDWGATAHMVLAMALPLVVLSVPYAVGVLPGEAFLVWTHVLMLPSMVAGMLLRRDEYVHDHHPAAGRLPVAGVR